MVVPDSATVGLVSIAIAGVATDRLCIAGDKLTANPRLISGTVTSGNSVLTLALVCCCNWGISGCCGCTISSGSGGNWRLRSSISDSWRTIKKIKHRILCRRLYQLIPHRGDQCQTIEQQQRYTERQRRRDQQPSHVYSPDLVATVYCTPARRN